MLGQGKNAWQAEIDAAAEVSLNVFFFPSKRTKRKKSKVKVLWL